MTDVITNGGKTAYRAGAIIAVATCLLLSWMNAAVGIAGNEENPVNLAFFALVAMVGAGAFISDGRARGLARALFCAAAFQMALGAIVSTGPVSNGEPHGSWGMIALNGFYALLWTASGALFAKAARTGHR